MEINDNIEEWVEIFRNSSEGQRFEGFMEYYDRLYKFQEQGNQKEVREYKTLIKAIRQIDDLGTPTPEEAREYDALQSKLAKNWNEIRICKMYPKDYRGKSITSISRTNEFYEAEMWKIQKRITNRETKW